MYFVITVAVPNAYLTNLPKRNGTVVCGIKNEIMTFISNTYFKPEIDRYLVRMNFFFPGRLRNQEWFRHSHLDEPP